MVAIVEHNAVVYRTGICIVLLHLDKRGFLRFDLFEQQLFFGLGSGIAGLTVAVGSAQLIELCAHCGNGGEVFFIPGSAALLLHTSHHAARQQRVRRLDADAILAVRVQSLNVRG
jgi:hypothetical protein